MSKRLIQDLHAGISCRDWNAVELTSNRLRDDVEKTLAILAGAGIGSLPDDYPLSELSTDALTAAFAAMPDDDRFGALQAAFLRGATWVQTNGGTDGVEKAAYDYADYRTSPITAAERAALERT